MIVSTNGPGPSGATAEEQTIWECVSTILRTRRGEVPGMRDFGLSWDAVDMPVPMAKALLSNQIKESVEKYEPRVIVRNVTFSTDEKGRLIPAVEVIPRE